MAIISQVASGMQTVLTTVSDRIADTTGFIRGTDNHDTLDRLSHVGDRVNLRSFHPSAHNPTSSHYPPLSPKIQARFPWWNCNVC